MSESEFEKLAQKAKGYGIDFNVLMAELDRRIESKQTAIARDIIDRIPSIKPDIDEISRTVAEKVQGMQVDLDAIVAKVIEQIPDTGEAERKRVMAEAAENISKLLGNIEQRIEGMVKPLVDKTIESNLAGMIQAVRDEMNSRMEEIAGKFQGAGAVQGSGGKWGGVPWEHLTPLIEKMISGGQDPLAGLDQIITLRERLASLEPASPDVNQQFRSASASFLEGIKLGSKVKGGVETKKLSGPAGGPSKSSVKPIKLHPAVEKL